ncbi:unnamed protein product [Penicillium salamii]|uniref:Uncharacterized protein n=1 Tax=Penicillium salamii TaxID=1612424 RepID=A0A9W4JZ96_9EURO|nr:unnamed protein product [Penicillium salamii]
MQKSGAGDWPNDLSQNEIMALVAPQKLNRKASQNRVHSNKYTSARTTALCRLFVPRLGYQKIEPLTSHQRARGYSTPLVANTKPWPTN